MTRLVESSSSSSEDEGISRLAQLREAAITLDHLKCEAQKEEARNSKSKRLSEQNDDFLLNVSPEFQEFVAKKLRSKLDESISWVTVEHSNTKNESLSLNNDFKLEILRNVYIDLNQKSEENDNKYSNVNKKKQKEKKSKKEKSKKDESSDSENEEKLHMLKEAVIDADFIMKSSCIDKHRTSF